MARLRPSSDENIPPETHQQHSYLIKCRRCTYIAQYIPKALEYFKRYLADPKTADSLDWYLSEDSPLKWNWPVGVLYDLSNSHGVWTLDLKHKPYPESILPLTPKSVEDYYTNQLKEACYIREGNANKVMNLSQQASKELWASIIENDFNLYVRTSASLFTKKDAIRSIPLRVYPPDCKRPLQPLIKPQLEDRQVTLGTVLHDLLPELFPSTRASLKARAVLHGVDVLLMVPMLELYEAAYPDGFLHVTVRE